MRRWLVALVVVAACGDNDHGGVVRTTPAVLDESLYVAISRGSTTELVQTSLDAEIQEVLWGTSTSTMFDSPLVALDDSIYWLRTDFGETSLMRIRLGWRSPTERARLAGRASGHLIASGGALYAQTSAGVWRIPQVGYPEQVVFGGVQAFAVDGDAVYFVSDAKLYSQVRGGSANFIAPVGATTGLSVHGGMVYASGEHGINRVVLQTHAMDTLAIERTVFLTGNENTVFAIADGRLMEIRGAGYQEVAHDLSAVRDVFATSSRFYYVRFADAVRDDIGWIDL